MEHWLEFKKAEKIIFDKEIFVISQNDYKKIKSSFNFLNSIYKNKTIYGINTGFGPMANHLISPSDLKSLQKNLIRSHASGCGENLDDIYVRATLLARVNSLSKGFSGVHPSLIKCLENYINYELYPIIPQHGGVGASGDLVQLAHIGLTILGEGQLRYKNKVYSTAQILKKLELEAPQFYIREGLALINGTSCMTGIGIVNIHLAQKAMDLAILFSCIINEIVKSFNDHFSQILNNLKHHKGQIYIAENMRSLLQTSHRIRNRNENHYIKIENTEVLSHKFQEYYSLRCVPQILGPIKETIDNANIVLENELNSVNDNPIIDYVNQEVYHGGNFHGDYVSFEMDKLKIAITKLTMLMERQLNFLVNPALNNILPPFVNKGTLGFNFGVQGLQFTAVSTTAENQTLSNPMYVHSIPNNNDNQDIVSMGTNAALLCKKVIDNSFEVLAIQAITITQALDCIEKLPEFSTKTQAFYRSIRTIIPTIKDDNVLYPYIPKIIHFLKQYS
ncbi:MAG: aromatic amino acid ammonia-lyase [Alphaproteobacteria bacterium]|nr:aromatic amino acid ammonia-lyase [Alphaproteobacteria bacterium]